MRLIFMGTPPFAVPSLTAVAAEHEVVAVVTQPDRPAGRGRVPSPSAVAVAATALGLNVIRTGSVRPGEVVSRLASLEPDVICVVAYGAILPPEVLDIPAHGCVNVHASLLPRWRGAAPVERAILAGDERTGVSIMRLEAGLDTGPVARVAEVVVDELNADQLRERLADEGARALVAVLRAMATGAVQWTPQTESGVTYADKLTGADVVLDPALDAVTLARRVRASSRSAPAHTLVAGRPVTVLAAHVVEDGAVPAGRVAVIGGALVLGAADGALEVDRLVPAGRGAMNGADWVRGARLEADAAWAGPA